MVPSLWAVSGTFSIQNFLHAQSKTRAVLVVTFIVTALHPCWCYLFIYGVGLGYLGAALAVSTSKIIELILLVTYVHAAALDTGLSLQCSTEVFKDWWPFLKLGLPNMVMMSEWWASEIIIFLSGMLTDPQDEVSAMSIYQSTLSICFMVPSSFQVSGSTRVGNALGANDAYAANLAATVAPMLAAISTVLLSFVLFFLRDRWGFIFTTDRSVVKLVERIMPVILVYIIADGIQSALTGVLKGMGKQRIGGPIVVFSYYAVGLPISYYLAFKENMGILGLCTGTTVGTAVHMLLYLAVCLRTNWKHECELVQQRQRRDARKHVADSGYDSNDDDNDDETWLESMETALSGVGVVGGMRRVLGMRDASPDPQSTPRNRGESFTLSLYRRMAKAVGIKVKPTEYELVQHYTDSLVPGSLDDDLIIM
jgi:MATE family multidrug resistance protein